MDISICVVILAHFTNDDLGLSTTVRSDRSLGFIGIANTTATLGKGVDGTGRFVSASTCPRRLLRYLEGFDTCLSSHLSFLSGFLGLLYSLPVTAVPPGVAYPFLA